MANPQGRRLPGDATVADMMKTQQRRAPKIRQLTPDELQAKVRGHLNHNPAPDNSDRLAIDQEGQIQLRVTEIDPYDRNPRRTKNDRYDEIKESIRSSRMQSPLVVTRRPGSQRYMVGAGGNTRLCAQLELWVETQESRFEYVLATYRPWESELKILAAHVVENELRGAMVFWDKAHGIFAMKAELEREQGKSLSLRQLHDALRTHGMNVSITLLSFYGFALDNLAELGEATRYLSGATVMALQPVFKHLSTYLISAHDRPPETWQAIRTRALRDIEQDCLDDSHQELESASAREQTIDPDAVIAALDRLIAAELGQSANQVRDIRALAKVMPKSTMVELIQHYQTQDAAKKARANRPATPPNTAVYESATPSPQAMNPPPPISSATAGNADDTHLDQRAADGLGFDSESESAEHPRSPDALRTAPSSVVATGGDVTVAPLKEVQRHITSFARLCGFADCLRLSDALPTGFYVETPANNAMLDMAPDTDGRSRYVGWWLAAMHSGQMSGDLLARLPADSTWRQAQLLEGDNDENSLTWLIESVLGNPVGLAEMADWLTLPGNQALGEYQQVLRTLQRLRHAGDQGPAL